MEILILRDGSVRAIYSDDLVPLIPLLGDVTVARASHVEPASGGGWTADMSPVASGLILGPFPKRAEALAAEVSWLREHGVPIP